jgi:hypothetical protein
VIPEWPLEAIRALYLRCGAFTEKLEDILDRGVDPLGEEGWSEIEATLAARNIDTIFTREILKYDIHDEVNARIDDPKGIRDVKGRVPEWVKSYQDGSSEDEVEDFEVDEEVEEEV